jgi:hypothetical protein
MHAFEKKDYRSAFSDQRQPKRSSPVDWHYGTAFAVAVGEIADEEMMGIFN